MMVDVGELVRTAAALFGIAGALGAFGIWAMRSVLRQEHQPLLLHIEQMRTVVTDLGRRMEAAEARIAALKDDKANRGELQMYMDAYLARKIPHHGDD